MYNTLKKYIRAIFPETVLRNIEKPLRRVYSIFYSGKNVFCPVCEGSFRRFIELKKGFEDSGFLCPRCGSVQRKRLLWLFLTRELKVKKIPLKILHFAPIACLADKLKSLPNINYVMTEYQNPHADRQHDITAIAETENTYDLVICYHVLEHIVDDRKAMQELHRILKPGGCALLQVPWEEETYEDFSIVDPAARKIAFRQDDHVRIYGREDFVYRLTQAGFSVEAVAYAKNLGKEAIKKFVLNTNEIIFVCRK